MGKTENQPRVLVIVPAFNEGKRIAIALSDLHQHMPAADVVVIDDGSSDDTAVQAGAAGAIVLRLPFNLGVGGAMQTGYLYAAENHYDVAVQFDGDGQHCAEDIAMLIEPVLTGVADLVIGSRMIGERTYKFSSARLLGSRLLMGMNHLLTGLKIADPTSGFRAASPRMIAFFSQYYPQSYLGDTVEALAMAAWHGMEIREMSARMRTVTTSSINNLRGLIHTIRICLALLIDKFERKLPMPPVNSKPSNANDKRN